MRKKRLVVILALVMTVAGATVFFILREKDKTLPSHTEYQQQVELPAATPENLLAETNKQRSVAGVPPLVLDERLDQSAQLKCREMVEDNYYAHQDPVTGKHGYEYISDLIPNVQEHAENLNKGFFNDAYTVVSDQIYGWMGSQTHREAMLSTDYKQVGFASCYAHSGNGSIGGTRFFVQHLANIP